MQTLVALYHNMSDAQSALDELVRSGIDRTKISLVANNTTGEYTDYVNSTYNTEDAVTAADGAAFGAASGGIIGALVGLGALAIPGIGPVIAAGPLVAALAGGAVGVLAGAPTGGIVAGLVKTHHIDAEDAEMYAEGIRRGDTLVTVQVDDADVSRTRDILNKYNPTDVHNDASTWRSEGWSSFDASTTPTTDDVNRYRTRTSPNTGLNTVPTPVSNSAATEPSRPIVERKNVNVYNEVTQTPVSSTDVHADHDQSYNAYDMDFRRHYQTRYSNLGHSYDVYLPAYRYGYTLASDPTYRDRDWLTFESNARSQWEREHPDTVWDDIKDAARYAWDKVRGFG
jgi:hypothetical protein